MHYMHFCTNTYNPFKAFYNDSFSTKQSFLGVTWMCSICFNISWYWMLSMLVPGLARVSNRKHVTHLLYSLIFPAWLHHIWLERGFLDFTLNTTLGLVLFRDEHKCSSATISYHISSLLYPPPSLFIERMVQDSRTSLSSLNLECWPPFSKRKETSKDRLQGKTFW